MAPPPAQQWTLKPAGVHAKDPPSSETDGRSSAVQEGRKGEKNGPLLLLLNMYSDSVFSILRVYVVQSHLPGFTSQTLRETLRRTESVCTFVHCGRDHVDAETKLFRGLTQLSAIPMLFLKSYYKKKNMLWICMIKKKKQRNKTQFMLYPWRFALPIKALI